MKMIEQLLAHSRASARRARARLPGLPPPGRLVVRLNDHGTPAGRPRIEGEPMNLKRWREVLAGFNHWLGPQRVTFCGGEPGRAALLIDLVRFANRLECPTHVITAGEGLDDDRIDALIGCGVGAVTVTLEDRARGMDRLEKLSAVRADWGRPVRLFAAARPDDAAAMVAIADQARALRLDGVVGHVPLGAPRPADGARGFAGLADMDRTSEALRRWLDGRPRSLPGGVRVEIFADGAITTSPLLPPALRIEDASSAALLAAWEGAGAASIRDARALERPWDEIELAPALLLSRR